MEAILLNNKLRILYSHLGLDGSPRILPSHHSDIDIDSDGRIYIAACRNFGYSYHYDCIRKIIDGQMSEVYRFTKRQMGTGEIVCFSEEIAIDDEDRKLCVPITIGRHISCGSDHVLNTLIRYEGNYGYYNPGDPSRLYQRNDTNPDTILDLSTGTPGFEGVYKNYLPYSSTMMIWRGNYLYYLNNRMNIVVLNCFDLSYVKTIPLWNDVVEKAQEIPSHLDWSTPTSSNLNYFQHDDNFVRYIYPKGLVRDENNIHVVFTKKERRTSDSENISLLTRRLWAPYYNAPCYHDLVDDDPSVLERSVSNPTGFDCDESQYRISKEERYRRVVASYEDEGVYRRVIDSIFDYGGSLEGFDAIFKVDSYGKVVRNRYTGHVFARYDPYYKTWYKDNIYYLEDERDLFEPLNSSDFNDFVSLLDYYYNYYYGRDDYGREISPTLSINYGFEFIEKKVYDDNSGDYTANHDDFDTWKQNNVVKATKLMMAIGPYIFALYFNDYPWDVCGALEGKKIVIGLQKYLVHYDSALRHVANGNFPFPANLTINPEGESYSGTIQDKNGDIRRLFDAVSGIDGDYNINAQQIYASDVLYDNVITAKIDENDNVECNSIVEPYHPKLSRTIYTHPDFSWRADIKPIYFKDGELYWVRCWWAGWYDQIEAYIDSTIIDLEHLHEADVINFRKQPYQDEYFSRSAGIMYKTNLTTLETAVVMNVKNHSLWWRPESELLSVWRCADSGKLQTPITFSPHITYDVPLLEYEAISYIAANKIMRWGYFDKKYMYQDFLYDLSCKRYENDRSDYDFYDCDYVSVDDNAYVNSHAGDYGEDLVVRGFGEIDGFGVVFDGACGNVIFHKEDRPTDFVHRLPVEFGLEKPVQYRGCMCSDLHYKLKYGIETNTNFYRNKLCLLIGEDISNLRPVETSLCVASLNLFNVPLSSQQRDRILTMQGYARSRRFNGTDLGSIVIPNTIRWPKVSVLMACKLLNRGDYYLSQEDYGYTRYPRSLSTVIYLDSIANEFLQQDLIAINTELTPQITNANLNYHFLVDSPYLDNFQNGAEEYPRWGTDYSVIRPNISEETENNDDRILGYYLNAMNHNTGFEFHDSMPSVSNFALIPKRFYDFRYKIVNISPFIMVIAEKEGDIYLGEHYHHYWPNLSDTSTNQYGSFTFFENFYGRESFLFGGQITRFYIEKIENHLLHIRIFGRAMLTSQLTSSGYCGNKLGTLVHEGNEYSYSNLNFPYGIVGLRYDGINSSYNLEGHNLTLDNDIIDGLITVEVADTSMFAIGDEVFLKEKTLEKTDNLSTIRKDIFLGLRGDGINTSYLMTDGIAASQNTVLPMNSVMNISNETTILEHTSSIIEDCDYVAGVFQPIRDGSALIFVGIVDSVTNLSTIYCYITRDGDNYIKNGILVRDVPVQKIGIRQITGRFYFTYFDTDNALHLAYFDHPLSFIESDNDLYVKEVAVIIQDKYNTSISYI